MGGWLVGLVVGLPDSMFWPCSYKSSAFGLKVKVYLFISFFFIRAIFELFWPFCGIYRVEFMFNSILHRPTYI